MRRRHHKTTIGGVLAAVGAVLVKAALLPPPFSVIPIALEAIGLAILGHSAADRSKVLEK